MFSKRIKALASLVDKNAIALDIGTDHAYLPIYLTKNKLVKKIDGSDISEKVIENAKNNVLKHNLETKIELFVSDGANNISNIYDTYIIAGMGFQTIKKILSSKKLPNTLIIQSNSEHYQLRKYMQSINYTISTEIVMQEKNIYYVLIKYIKGHEKLNQSQLHFGKANNLEYLLHIKNKYRSIKTSVPIIKKYKYIYYIYLINILLKKNRIKSI